MIIPFLDDVKDVLSFIADVLGIIAFAIAIITLVRVHSVQKTQEEERRLLHRIYGIESLVVRLRSASVFLRKTQDVDASDLAEDLIRICGQIEGIMRVLNIAGNESKSNQSAIPLLKSGYMTPQFQKAAVMEARHAVDFLVIRSMQFANVDLMEEMRSAALRGVRIRILAISASASDTLLQYATNFLPWPVATSAAELRGQLQEVENRMRQFTASSWPEEARRRFLYRGYNLPPNMHFARVDSVIRQGFVGTLSSAQPGRLEDRPYIELSTNSAPGSSLMTHFDQLWDLSAADQVVPLSTEAQNAVQASPPESS
ncbi:hypothetical protein [Actinoplanes rectilineatus]|uniref:hypothetical protein n=1 Tax=Actinoplanes rectilineatus TaxID=113571 RepID=UPI0005F27FAE|nr:hypothetical protein [Actinoplanes rectilineatus]